MGREIATLVNEDQQIGYYRIPWNAGNLSSGVYFYSLTAGGFAMTKKFIVVK